LFDLKKNTDNCTSVLLILFFDLVDFPKEKKSFFWWFLLCFFKWAVFNKPSGFWIVFFYNNPGLNKYVFYFHQTLTIWTFFASTVHSKNHYFQNFRLIQKNLFHPKQRILGVAWLQGSAWSKCWVFPGTGQELSYLKFSKIWLPRNTVHTLRLFYCCNLSGGVALIVWFTTNGMCVNNNTIIYVARASNSKRDCEHDLYYCLLPQCEALRICRSGFPIATLSKAVFQVSFLPVWGNPILTHDLPTFHVGWGLHWIIKHLIRDWIILHFSPKYWNLFKWNSKWSLVFIFLQSSTGLKMCNTRN